MRQYYIFKVSDINQGTENIIIQAKDGTANHWNPIDRVHERLSPDGMERLVVADFGAIALNARIMNEQEAAYYVAGSTTWGYVPLIPCATEQAGNGEGGFASPWLLAGIIGIAAIGLLAKKLIRRT